MDGWTIYQELKGWQSGIGAVLGFGGLIAGALFNARLNRKRDDRLREAEAITIALSLYGEIKLLRENAAAMARGISYWYLTRGAYGDDLPDYYRETYPPREPTLYNALASKLGMLDPQLLLTITKFYSDYETAVGHFPKLFKREGSVLSYGAEWVIEPAVRAVLDIEEGLRRIEQLGGISASAAAPSVGRADEALDLAEAQRPDPD